MKKIAFVANAAYTLYLFRLGIMRRLRELGYEVVCIAPFDERVDELRQEGFRLLDLKLKRKGTSPLEDLRLLRDLCGIYRREEFTIAFHYTVKINIFGSIAAKLAGIPAFGIIPGLGYVFERENWLSSLVGVLYKISLKFPEKVFFLNEDDREFFLTRKFISSSKAAIIHSEGVDTEYYVPRELPHDGKKGFVFLFLGRFLRDKGLVELAEAFKQVHRRHPDAELWLLGRIDKDNPAGISEDIIRSLEKNEGIKYLGETQDVRPFIAQSDVFVYPSYYREGVPRGLLEAMSMEKPIITTDSVGCRDVIEDGKNGFMVRPRDVGSLAQAMSRMLELSQPERVEMGKRGRMKAVAEFNEKRIIETYLRVINELGPVRVPIGTTSKLQTDSSLIRREPGRIVLKSRGATFFELGEVARLHQNGIKTGFLSFLGFDFLVSLYQAISKSGAGILIVALRDEKVIGFVSGAEAIRPVYQQLWKDNFLVLPFVIFLKIFSWKTLRKIFDLLIYSFPSKEKKNRALSAELLSMAVEEKSQGQGVAQALFERLTVEFKSRRIQKFKIVVGDNLKQAQRFYEKMGAQKVQKLELHKGETSWEYVFELKEGSVPSMRSEMANGL